MSDFAFAVRHVLEQEGVFSDHPSDPGDETKYGITEQVARLYGYEGDMQELPRAFAVRVYEEHYWSRIRLYEIDSRIIAAYIFDAQVNQWWGTYAAQLGARLLGTLRRGSMRHVGEREREAVERFEGLSMRRAIDGRMGPVTLAVVNALAKLYESELLAVMAGWRLRRYTGSSNDECRKAMSDFEARGWPDDFIRGWAGRTFRFGRMTT